MDDPRDARRRRDAGAETLGAAAALTMLGAGLLLRPVATAPLTAAGLLAAYAAVAATMAALSVLAWRGHRAWRLPVALAGGAVLCWHLRELSFRPSGGAELATALAVAATLWGLAVAAAARRVGPRGLRRTAALGIAAGLLAAAATAGSPVLRWQLLRHHTLLGTPLYYLGSPAIGEVRADLWSVRTSGTPAPAPRPVPLPDKHAVAAAVGAATDPGPPIAFVLVDTLRADALAAMPAVAAWAERAVRFTDVQGNASWTRPAVATMFTGLLPEEHGAVDRTDAIATADPTLAEHLQARGYRTTAFVTNFAAAGRAAGFARGFDAFHELDDPVDAYVRAGAVADLVERWLDSAVTTPADAAGRFVYVHLLDPHRPYLSGDAGGEWPAALRRGYDAELRYLDRELPRMLAMLRDRLGPRAVLLLTSDHGEEFGEHGGVDHGHTLYDELLHLPLVVDAPGAAPAVVTAPLDARAIFHLLLTLADDPQHDLPRWAAAVASDRRYASLYLSTDMGWHRPHLGTVTMRSWQDGPWQLIWSAYGPTWELYDRRRDPAQLHNRIGDASAPRARLTAALERTPARWAKRVPMAAEPAATDQLRALGYVQ